MDELVATNRKANRDFSILESFETGIELKGTEVKSLREHRVNLKDSFARIERGEIFLYNMHISPYEFGNIYNHDPLRVRKLLLHKAEVRQLIGPVTQKGLTLVPLKVYFKGGLAKVELALAKGKRKYDKRQTIKRKEQEREIERGFKGAKGFDRG